MSSKRVTNLIVSLVLLIVVVCAEPDDKSSKKPHDFDVDPSLMSSPSELGVIAPLAGINPIAETQAKLLNEAQANPQLVPSQSSVALLSSTTDNSLLDVATEESFQTEFIKSVMENVRAIETRYKPDEDAQLERDEEWTLGLARIRNGMRSHPGPMSPMVQATINAFLEEKPIRGEVFKLMIRLETLVMAHVDKLLAKEKQVSERNLAVLAKSKAYINRLVDLFTLEETGQNCLPDRYFQFIKNDRRVALVDAKLLERSGM